MSTQKVGGYISEIQFKNGTSIELQQSDIVIFVGPNNAGKSQCLRDIRTLAENETNGIVVSNVIIKKYDARLEPLLKKIANHTKNGTVDIYQLFNNFFGEFRSNLHGK